MNHEDIKKKIIFNDKKKEISLVKINSGGFTDFFSDKYDYLINVLNTSVRVISNGKNNEQFFIGIESFNIGKGEKFQIQNISSTIGEIVVIKL